MKILGKTALGLLAFGGWTAAQATDVEMTIDVAGVERTVVITLDEKIAPKTSANFAKLCSEGFYDGIAFHRIIANYIVQGGDPLTKDPEARAKWGTGGPGYTVPAELGGKHVRGAVAAARLGDAQNPERASSGSQFYVTLRDVAPLDGQYTVFGTVTKGLEVFDEIAGAPADKNNVPTASIKITGTKVLAPEPPASLTSAKPAPPTSEPAVAQNTAANSRPAPAPAPSPEPNPLSAKPSSADDGSGIRFTPQTEETMEVNVDRGTPAMPRLQTNVDKMVEATKKLTGREDGFVPMTGVGARNTAAPAPAPAPTAAPVPEPQPVTLPNPAPVSSAAEPDPLSGGNGASTPTAAGSATPIPPSGETPPPSPSAGKPAKPHGPLGRFLRRIW